VLFDRICRDNGIAHRLAPATAGQVERFHATLRRELLDAAGISADMASGQAGADARVRQHHERPHQACRWPLGVAGNDRLTP
jgi:transposase InsO family protein